MNSFLLLALSLNATVYGLGEFNCGDYDQEPQKCAHGAITASGVTFDPKEIGAALPMPRNRRLRPTSVWLKTDSGYCLEVPIIDKGNERYVGVRGLDLTPATVHAITGKPATSSWSGKLEVCDVSEGTD